MEKRRFAANCCTLSNHLWLTEILWQLPRTARPVSSYISRKTSESQQHKSATGLGHEDRKWHKCWFFPESQDISATDIIPNYTWARTSQTPRGVTDYAKPVPHKPNGAWPDYLQLSATPQHKPSGNQDDDSSSRSRNILENVKKSKYDFCKISVLKHLRIGRVTWKASGWRCFEIQPEQGKKIFTASRRVVALLQEQVQDITLLGF